MISGDRERFAIEAVIGETVGKWVFGHFRFWLCGTPVGNWEDWTDLKGCVSWLRDFAATPRERYEPSLQEVDANELFRRAHGSAMHRGIVEPSHRLDDAYGRFYISHLGMSSFDRFDVLLVKDADGAERCLWREGDAGQISECRLPANEMERVALEFCDQFEPALLGGSRA